MHSRPFMNIYSDFFPKQEYSGPYRPPEYLNGKEVVDFSPEQEVIKYKPKSK